MVDLGQYRANGPRPKRKSRPSQGINKSSLNFRLGRNAYALQLERRHTSLAGLSLCMTQTAGPEGYYCSLRRDAMRFRDHISRSLKNSMPDSRRKLRELASTIKTRAQKQQTPSTTSPPTAAA
jgi:hypothetical protein